MQTKCDDGDDYDDDVDDDVVVVGADNGIGDIDNDDGWQIMMMTTTMAMIMAVIMMMMMTVMMVITMTIVTTRIGILISLALKNICSRASPVILVTQG
ncbi:hypothetical protein ACF0H5_000782 [Mactra antiquata]